METSQEGSGGRKLFNYQTNICDQASYKQKLLYQGHQVEFITAKDNMQAKVLGDRK
jgi:hypothetical protein